MTFISAIVSDIISFPNDDALMKLFNLAEMDHASKVSFLIRMKETERLLSTTLSDSNGHVGDRHEGRPVFK